MEWKITIQFVTLVSLYGRVCCVSVLRLFILNILKFWIYGTWKLFGKFIMRTNYRKMFWILLYNTPMKEDYPFYKRHVTTRHLYAFLYLHVLPFSASSTSFVPVKLLEFRLFISNRSDTKLDLLTRKELVIKKHANIHIWKFNNSKMF